MADQDQVKVPLWKVGEALFIFRAVSVTDIRSIAACEKTISFRVQACRVGACVVDVIEEVFAHQSSVDVNPEEE